MHGVMRFDRIQIERRSNEAFAGDRVDQGVVRCFHCVERMGRRERYKEMSMNSIQEGRNEGEDLEEMD